MHHPPQEIRILNRIVSVNEQGLTYEADPRHTDLLMSSLDRTEANSSGTPGVKPTDRNDLADKVDEPSNTKLDDYSDLMLSLHLSSQIPMVAVATHGKPLKKRMAFSRIYGVFRKALTHPADIMKNVEHLRPMRLTCDTYSMEMIFQCSTHGTLHITT